VYAYFTTPLPLGLSGVIRTPGSASAPIVPVATGGTGASARAGAGQPLVLGAVSVSVQSVERNQDLTAAERGSGPPGVFTVLDVQLANAGAEPLMPSLSDFRLLDDQGRTYTVDAEATRAVNAFSRRRNVSDSGVPPGAAVATFLAFETTASTNPVALRVTLGYGELELPRQ
jgi:hypothetical protein